MMTNLHSDVPSKELLEYTSSPTPYVVQDELTFLDFLVIIAQRKKLIAIITAICAASAVAIAFLLPEQYAATVIILPPQGNASVDTMPASQVADESAESGKASSAPGSKNLNEMYVAMLKSHSVEDAVIQRYGLMAQYHKNYLLEARKALETHTKIDGSNKDGLIRLEFSDRNPARAAEIANGYVEQFQNFSKHLALTEASQRRVVFETQLEKTKTDLENADEALKRTQFAKPAGSEKSSNEAMFVPKGTVPQPGLESVRRLRDVKYYEAIFDVLVRQLELARLDEAKEGAVIQVVDPAVPPEKKSFPKRSLIILSGTAAGFTFGLMFALLQGGLARIQHNPATRDKLTLLGGSIWMRKTAKAPPGAAEPDKVKDLGRRPEATG
jgi:tyrosine-protein kinase Etk/Wzc